MPSTLQPTVIQALREYLHSNLGLSYSENHENDLVRKIGYAAKEFGFVNSERFAHWLLSNQLSEIQRGVLASHLTIGETYFMREKKGFDFLEQVYLPGLIKKRQGTDRQLRVWCAGCATGEEAYSLAIVLRESIPDIQQWKVSILATDINSVFLEKARKGVFTKWSFRTNSEKFTNKYFTREGPNEFHLLPAIKKMVTFSSLNLAEGCYPSMANNTNAIDIIFCRNVLIYFSPEGTQGVVGRLCQSLVKGGILIVSPVEMSLIDSPWFKRIAYLGYSIYEKGDRKTEKVKPGSLKAELTQSLHLVRPAEVKKDPGVFLNDQIQLNRLKKLLPENLPVKPQEINTKDYERAIALYKQGAYQEAEVLLAALIKLESADYKREIVLLAKTKANLGKLKEAEELCEMALHMDKLDPALYYLMANVMQELGNDHKAIHLLNQSIYLDVDFVLAHYLLGNLSVKSGNAEAGRKSFKNAMISLAKLSPDDVLAESEGMTAQQFREILQPTKGKLNET